MDERVFWPLIIIFAVIVSSVAVIVAFVSTRRIFSTGSREPYKTVPPEEGRASPAV